MSVIAPITFPPPTPPPAGAHQRPFTVDEYHRMIAAGVLTGDDPVELLEGWVVYKMPRNPPHDATVDRPSEALSARLPKDPPGWRVHVQPAITTGDSEPEPDIVVAIGPAGRYDARHPGPRDIALVVEVADSSLDRDRDDKGRVYARAGIPVYWIINLPGHRVEVYTNPSGPGAQPAYAARADFDPAASVALVVNGQKVADVPLRDLLP